MTYSIRQVELVGGYIDSIEEMDRTCFPFDEMLPFDGSWWWVAFDEDDVPVGYAGLAHLWGDRGFLCRVGVLPKARGNGLQRKFVRARQRGARGLEFSRIVTYTDRKNVVSSNNLIRCGYSLYRPTYEWGTSGALYWYRDL